MGSPRSMWSGTIQFGLLNVPVTIAKAWEDVREKSLITLCTCCEKPVDRTERCPDTGKPPEGKVRGVELPEGGYHVLLQNEMSHIEEATKSSILAIQEFRSPQEIPQLQFSTGTYYLRANEKVPGSETPFVLFMAALAKTGKIALAIWGTSSREKLVVIQPTQDGLLILRTIPMAHELRPAGEKEMAHLNTKIDSEAVALATQLVEQSVPSEPFDLSSYEDNGLLMRSAAVERILSGHVPEDQDEGEPKMMPATDLLATLQASLKMAEGDK